MKLPIPTPVFHLTHIDNLSGIIKEGGLASHNRKIEKGITHKNIAYHTLQDRRAETAVDCSPFGSLHDYVPFFLGPRPPMLYAINNGKVETYQEGQAPIVYLVSMAQDVTKAGLGFVFTDGHAIMKPLTNFFNDLDNIAQVNWQFVYAKQWNDTQEYPDRRRQKQAEFLVKDFFPWSLVLKIAVINKQMKENVKKLFPLNRHNPLVILKPEWYY